jgi:hypothetical protein
VNRENGSRASSPKNMLLAVAGGPTIIMWIGLGDRIDL